MICGFGLFAVVFIITMIGVFDKEVSLLMLSLLNIILMFLFVWNKQINMKCCEVYCCRKKSSINDDIYNVNSIMNKNEIKNEESEDDEFNKLDCLNQEDSIINVDVSEIEEWNNIQLIKIKVYDLLTV